MPPIRTGEELVKTRGASNGVASENLAPGPVPSSSISLSMSPSIDLSKYLTKVRKKKWSPLSLSEIGSSGIATLDAISQGPTRRRQRNRKAAVFFTSNADAFPQLKPPTQEPSNSYDHNTSGIDRQSDFYVDPNLTPTQSTFSRPPTLVPSEDKVALAHTEDSESTKGQLEDIMVRLDDAFDSEEWDPEPPSVDRTNSPEPLTVKPQPVTYTTVGSLVKDNAIPQFTAPVRIQREGASRRPPQAPVQPRTHDSFFSPRTTTPQIGMGFAGPSQRTPQYSQQRQSMRSPHSLSDPEKEVLLKSLGVTSTNRPSNIPALSNLRAKADPFSINPTMDNFTAQMLHDNSNVQSSQALGPPSGFTGNMRTTQRLPYYSDPVHDAAFDRAARERLSESSAANLRSYNQAHAMSASLRPSESFGAGNTRSATPNTIKRGPEPAQQKAGNLNPGYRFPPPGLPNPSNVSTPSADYAFQPSYNLPGPGLTGTLDQASSFVDCNARPGYNTKSTGAQDTVSSQNQAKSGYPQPLTAGPPGQRQNPMTNRQNLMPLLSILTGNSRSGDGSSAANLPSNSPWITNSVAYPRQSTFTSVPTEASKICDTLPPEEAAKYYPNGFPADYTGVSLPLQETFGKMNLADPSPEDQSPKDTEQKREKWWYHGVRKAHMTREEHLNELERLEVEHQSIALRGSAGTMPRPPPRPMREYPKLTIDQINEMTDAEVTAPLLDNLFGTLLGYADRIVTPNKLNMSELSRFGPSPPYQIDTSEKGNNSFFGDDQGKVPKRWARDPRDNNSN
jgi:hypothetical protein